MTPDKIAKSGSEHAHQSALFAFVAIVIHHGFAAAWEWADAAQGYEFDPVRSEVEAVPELQWFHAIHNQGHGDAIRGGKAKAEGVRAGVADTFLPVKRGEFSGLYIEMKKPSEKPAKPESKGGVSDKQKEFGIFVRNQSFGWIVCYDWRSAAKTLQAYIEWRIE